MSGTALGNTKDAVPRSKAYRDKEIVKETYTVIKGTRYYKRVFFDGSVELVRYDHSAERWIFLLFAE